MFIINSDDDGHKRCYNLNITEEQFKCFQEGQPIKDIIPELNQDEIEFLISGRKIPNKKLINPTDFMLSKYYII